MLNHAAGLPTVVQEFCDVVLLESGIDEPPAKVEPLKIQLLDEAK